MCVSVFARARVCGMCDFDAGSHSSLTDKIGWSSSSSRDRDMDTFVPLSSRTIAV